MKHCNICHRELITKRHMGLCAGCFANVRDFVIVLLLPVVCFLYVISPIDLFSELITKFIGPAFWVGYIDDALVIIGGLVLQVFKIVGLFKRKHPI